MGIVSDENSTVITLRQPDGIEIVWPRLNIEALQAQPWSLMPLVFHQALGQQDLADLMQYIMGGRR